MKKWLSMLLLIVLLSHALPLNALAAIGKVLTPEELAAAYTLTGFDREASGVQGNAAYHKGMKPNATWNAMQLSDWLDDLLRNEMFNVEDIISRASVAMAKLKEKNPGAYERLSGGDPRYGATFANLQQMYLDAEAVREEMRYAQDYLEERANLIAEMGSQLEEQGGSMFSSERVRLSAKIETAAKELNDARGEIAGKAEGWTSSIQNWSARLGLMTEGADDGSTPSWFEELYSYEDGPVENTARVVTTSASNSRMGKLSTGASLLASNDAQSDVFVLSEDQIAIEIFTGKKKDITPVEGVEVTVMDVRDPHAEPITRTTDDNGRILLMSNLFMADDSKYVHLKLDVNGEVKGYRSFGVEECNIKMGESYKGILVPLDDKPYIYSASFHGYDIWTEKFEMLYSHLIDVDFDIKVVTRNPGGEGLTPTLRFAYFKKDDGASGVFGKFKKHFVDATTRDGNTYVFMGPWKKNISPWLSEEQYPYFTFDSADEDEKLRYNTRLISKKSAVDKPFEAGTLAFVNVIGEGFSFKINIPGAPFPAAIKLNVPLKEYAPQISIDIAGNVNLVVGSPALKAQIEKSKLNWKNHEMQKLKLFQKHVEQKGFLANQKAQFSAAYDYYTMKKHTILQESKIDVGGFMLLSGRWVLDNTMEDVKATVITFRAGVGMLLKYSYSWTIRGMVFGAVPMYLTLMLSVSAGFQINWEVGFSWVNGAFHNWSLRPVRDFTILIGVAFTATLGVGIKGFVELWCRFVAGLNFRLHFSVMSQEPSTFSGDFFMNVTVGYTFFLATFSMDLWQFAVPLFNEPLPFLNAIPPLQQYTAANAEPEVEQAATQEPMSYPGLVPTAQQVNLRGSEQRARTRVAVIDGQTYLFYLANVTGKDKKQHMRLNWVNVADNSKTGTTQTAIDAWSTGLNARNDYAFDVLVADGYVFLLVACAKAFDENGLPKPNANLRNADQCNQIFYVSMLQSNGKGNLTATLKKGYYLTGFQKAPETGPAPEYELVDHVLVTGRPVGYAGGSGNSMYYYDSIDNPEITWAKAFTEKGVDTCLGVEIFGTFGRVAYSEDDIPYGITSFEMVPYAGSPHVMIPDADRIKCFSDEFVESGMGKDYVRTEVRGAMRCTNTEPKVHDAGVDRRYSPAFLALSQPKDGGEGERAIELFDFEMNGVNHSNRETIVLERGDIEHFEMAQTAVDGDGTNYRRMVFYTAKETGDDGDVRSRLYGLYLEPIQREGREMTFDVTKYTYDLTVPTEGQFSLAYIGEVPYLYWITTAPMDSADAPNVFRIMATAYDMATNTMTAPAVYAEFQLPNYTYLRSYKENKKTKKYSIDLTQLPQNVLLTGTGTAYLSAVSDTSVIPQFIKAHNAPESFMPKVPPVTLYSFPVQMKPLLELKELLFEDTTVCVGAFEDISLIMMNTGNMGVAKFDLELYTKENDKVKVEETIHADCLHPEQSTLIMQGSKEAEELPERTPVIYRDGDFDYTSRQRDWVLEHEKKRYKLTIGSRVNLDSVETVDSDTQFIKTDMLMPGVLATFTGTVKIPDNWNGKTTLYMRIAKISTYANWVRAMANAAGAKANGIVANAAPEELTWALDEASGQLVLQTGQLSPNGPAANAARSGIIANAVEAPGAITVAVANQDIDVSHRVYRDSEGNDMLDIIISNYNATDDSFKLTCAVYLDHDKEPYYVSLPYYAGGLANRHTHTITMPVDALVPDPQDHHQARVVITPVGREESATVNNEFTIDLGGNALHIIEQPEDQTVQEGEDVSFDVEVGGGVKPYSYQWQVWDEKHQKWVDLPGFTEPTLSRKNIEKKWDGCRFRCVVTDANGVQVITDEVTLTVRDRVDTGDHSNLLLYLTVALAAMALLWLVRRRMKRMG